MTDMQTKAEEEAYRDGLSLGLTAAALIADQAGYPKAKAAILENHRRYFPQPNSAECGEREWQAWMVEMELQSWTRHL